MIDFQQRGQKNLNFPQNHIWVADDWQCRAYKLDLLYFQNFGIYKIQSTYSKQYDEIKHHTFINRTDQIKHHTFINGTVGKHTLSSFEIWEMYMA